MNIIRRMRVRRKSRIKTTMKRISRITTNQRE